MQMCRILVILSVQNYMMVSLAALFDGFFVEDFAIPFQSFVGCFYDFL